MILVGEREDYPGYLVGLVISAKDQRSIFRLVMEVSGDWVISREGGDEIAVLNMFVLHKRSHRGLYQHYHQSYAVTTFCQLISRVFREMQDEAFNAEAALIPEGWGRKAALKRLRRRYRGKLDYRRLADTRELRARLRTLRRIRRVTVKEKYLGEREPPTRFTPLRPKIYSMNAQLSFVQDASPEDLIDGIVEMAGRPWAGGSVTGDDANDVERSIKFMKDALVYYEELADMMSFRILDFAESGLADLLLETATGFSFHEQFAE